MNVLVAGGAGTSGPTRSSGSRRPGHVPVVYDDLSRGHKQSVDINRVPLVQADLNDKPVLLRALRDHQIDAVMHFAAFAYVGESVQKPLMYYHNNVATTVSVLETMKEAGVDRFVFSSTCATYGDPDRVPITEDEKKKPVSPYGRSKLMVEEVLGDVKGGWPTFKYAALRYFNASGCAMDGTLGEDHDPETHLIPVVLQHLLGVRPGLTVFGTDYPTKDGTNVRDYIHVDDLADAHILAMGKLDTDSPIICNLGTGNGFSVREIIAAAERVAGKKADRQLRPRRAGDAIALYADPSKAKAVLGWEAKHKDPESIIRSAWNWFKDHPTGYPKK